MKCSIVVLNYFLVPFFLINSLFSQCLAESSIPQTIRVSTNAFVPGSTIPNKYTCDGGNIHPALFWKGIPSKTKSLVIIVEDPDAPIGTWTHWMVWNLSPRVSGIGENKVIGGMIQGRNDFGKNNYKGPCPPYGTHRYFFKVLALDLSIQLPPETRRIKLDHAMKGHVLAEGNVMGTYSH
jgi:Raf kinase inhibitor-like YbhB/YbcL family protein